MARIFLTKKWLPWIGAIVALTLVTYGAAIDNQFIPFDDNTLIYMNPSVQHLTLTNLFHVFSSYDPELYIPLTFVAYQLLHLFFGFQAGAYHAASLLLHILNTLLVIHIVWQLTKRRPIALIAGLLFAVHPLQSEAVLWAAAMKDMLSSFFGLLSFAFFLQWRETELRSAFRWCVAFFAIGLLCKVSIVLFPFLFLLTDWYKGRRVDKKTVIAGWPFALLGVVFIAIALGGKTKAIGGAGIVANLLLPFKATGFYLLQLIWPFRLSILYPEQLPIQLTDPVFLLSIAVVILLLLAAFFSRKTVRIITLGILWYLLLLLPSYSTFFKNEHLYFASARYAYLPTIGIFLIVAFLGVWLWDRSRMLRVPLACIGGVLTLACIALSHKQVAVWHDSRSLFANVIRLYPISPVAYNNEGTTYNNSPESLPLFEKAIALDPSFIIGYRNIAGYYRDLGDRQKMQQAYASGSTLLLKKAHPLDDDLSLLYEYAEFFDDQGDRASALSWLQKAVDLNPNYALSYYNLGVKEEKYGQLDEASVALQKAADLNNSDPDTLYHLAAVLAAKGQLPQAADLLQRVININPEYAEARQHLADIRKILTQ